MKQNVIFDQQSTPNASLKLSFHFFNFTFVCLLNFKGILLDFPKRTLLPPSYSFSLQLPLNSSFFNPNQTDCDICFYNLWSSLILLIKFNHNQPMLPPAPVANFVHKTFQILRLEQHFSVIAWLPSGRQFIIKCSETFEATTLPRYFRHRNVNSFIRQLNMYGFHKSRREPSKLIFSHPCFLQGREDLLAMVKRKLKNEPERQEREGEREGEIVEEVEDGEERRDGEGERREEKQQLLCSQATKFSLEGEERAMAESLSPDSTALLPNSSTDCEQIFAINSFFNIDYEGIELRGLLANRSLIMEGNAQAYLRMEEAPSLREIGTEEFLLCADRERKGRDSFPVRIFETRNCMFDLDI